MPHLTTAERIGRKLGKEEGVAIGREEGEVIGLERGKIEEALASILEILAARQGEVPDQTAARLTQITDLDRLRHLRRLLVNGALADFAAELSRLAP